MTSEKLVLRQLKVPAIGEDSRVSVRFTATDLVNDEDTILILSPEELQALIYNYEVGATNRLRARLQYYKRKPDAKRRGELYLPAELRVHKDGSLEQLG